MEDKGYITPALEDVDTDEFESVTNRGMLEDEQNCTRKDDSSKLQSQNDSQSSSTNIYAARDGGWQQSSSKKRKGLDSATPANNKPKKDYNKTRVKSRVSVG